MLLGQSSPWGLDMEEETILALDGVAATLPTR
jgi:hypothetical protein